VNFEVFEFFFRKGIKPRIFKGGGMGVCRDIFGQRAACLQHTDTPSQIPAKGQSDKGGALLLQFRNIFQTLENCTAPRRSRFQTLEDRVTGDLQQQILVLRLHRFILKFSS